MLPGSASSITPSDILGLTRFLTGTLDNTAAYSDANIIAVGNVEYRAMQAELLSALNYDWKESTIDGTGSGSIALTADDNSYAFPTDLIQIDRIEISYTGEINSYVEATIIPLQGMDGGVLNTSQSAAVMGSKARPVVYVRNNVIYLDPIPSVTVSGGLRIWGQTLVADLAVGGTAPLFAAAFHEIIAYRAANVWCDGNEMEKKANTLLQKAMMKFRNMVAFYSTRNATDQPVMRSKNRSMK